MNTGHALYSYNLISVLGDSNTLVSLALTPSEMSLVTETKYEYYLRPSLKVNDSRQLLYLGVIFALWER